jgi:hypothetical protein
VDLVHGARRQPSILMRAVEVGEHLDRELRDLLAAEGRLDVASVHLLVAVDRVRRPALAAQLDDPLGEQIVERRPRSGVPALAHLDDQLGSRLLRLAQRATERATDLSVFAGDRITPGLDHDLPDTRRSFAHPRRRSRVSHGDKRTPISWICLGFLGYGPSGVSRGSVSSLLDDGGAGGHRTHDRRIMSPLL